MKKIINVIRNGSMITLLIIMLSASASANSLPEVRKEVIRLRQQLSELQTQFDSQWLLSHQTDDLQDQSPFESDLSFLKRYLTNSGALQISHLKQQNALLEKLHELLSWNFHTSSMSIALDVSKYNANTEIWDVIIRHQDWAAQELDFKLDIPPRQAEKLYNHQSDISIFGDIVLDMQSRPQLQNIYISCQPAGLDTTISMGALQSYKLPNSVTAIEFDLPHNRLLAGSRDKALYSIDLDSGKDDKTVRLYSNINQIRKIPRKNQVLIALQDGYLRLWNLENKQEIFQHRQFGSVEDVAINPDGRFAVSAALDNRLRIFDLNKNRQLLELEYAYGINSCHLSPDGNFLAYGTEHGYSDLFEYAIARVYEAGSTSHLHQFNSSDAVQKVRFSPDSSLLLYSAADGTAVIADLVSGEKLSSFNRAYQAEWLHGTKTIIAVGYDRQLKIISTQNQQIIKTLTHSEDIICFKLSPCQNYVAIGSQSGIYLYKL